MAGLIYSLPSAFAAVCGKSLSLSTNLGDNNGYMNRLISLAALVILSAFAVFPQSDSDREFLNEKFWSALGKPSEGPRGFSLFTRDLQPKGDSYFEFWLKIVPAEPAAFARRYSLAREITAIVQYTSVDCRKKIVSAERVRAFSADLEPVSVKGSAFARDEKRVRAGTINETVFQRICLSLE